MREIITTRDAPGSPLYSQAMKAGPHVYVSGLVGVDASTGQLEGSTIQEQTRQALLNCEAILHAAGATLENVVEVGVLPTSPADFAGVNEEYAKSRLGSRRTGASIRQPASPSDARTPHWHRRRGRRASRS